MRTNTKRPRNPGRFFVLLPGNFTQKLFTKWCQLCAFIARLFPIARVTREGVTACRQAFRPAFGPPINKFLFLGRCRGHGYILRNAGLVGPVGANAMCKQAIENQKIARLHRDAFGFIRNIGDVRPERVSVLWRGGKPFGEIGKQIRYTLEPTHIIIGVDQR